MLHQIVNKIPPHQRPFTKKQKIVKPVYLFFRPILKPLNLPEPSSAPINEPNLNICALSNDKNVLRPFIIMMNKPSFFWQNKALKELAEIGWPDLFFLGT